MKKIFSALLLVFALNSAFAQQTTFKEGEQIMNVGIGIGNALYGNNYTNKIPPISASYEIGIIDNLFDAKSSIGVGGYFGFTGAKYEWNTGVNIGGYKYKSFVLGPRGYFHYQLIDNLDTYAGLMLGYNIVHAKEFGANQASGTAESSSFNWSLFAGARYYLSRDFAAMIEFGHGVSYINLGLAISM